MATQLLFGSIIPFAKRPADELLPQIRVVHLWVLTGWFFSCKAFYCFMSLGKAVREKTLPGEKPAHYWAPLVFQAVQSQPFLPERHVLHGTTKTKILYWECFCESFQVERAKQDGNVPAWERQREGVKLISSRRQIPNWRNGTGGIWLPPPFENLSLD